MKKSIAITFLVIVAVFSCFYIGINGDPGPSRNTQQSTVLFKQDLEPMSAAVAVENHKPLSAESVGREGQPIELADKQPIATPIKPVILRGRVVNGKNQPVANAEIIAERLSRRDQLTGFSFEAFSNRNGLFQLECDLQGSYELTVWAPGYCAVVMKSVSILSTRKSTIEIQLQKSYSISGVVLDPNGVGVENALVFLNFKMESRGNLSFRLEDSSAAFFSEPIKKPIQELLQELILSRTSFTIAKSLQRSSVYTDNQGKFTLEEVAPGSCLIYTFHSDWPPVKPYKAIAGAKGVTLRFEQGGSLEGRVVDPAGAPIVDVEIMRTGFSDYFTLSDRQGYFKLPGLTHGAVELTAKRDGYLAGRVQGIVFTGESKMTNDIILRPNVLNSISGKILYPDEKVARGVIVEVKNNGEVLKSVISNDNGDFKIDGLPGGKFMVVMRLGRYLRQREITMGYPPQLDCGDCFLDRALYIEGRVENHAGLPLAGVRLSCNKFNDFDSTAAFIRFNGNVMFSDAQGRFKLGPFSPRVVRVEASGRGYAPKRLKFSLLSSDINDALIQFDGVNPLVLRIVDEYGNAIEGALASFVLGRLKDVSNENGEIKLWGVEGPHASVQISKLGYGSIVILQNEFPKREFQLVENSSIEGRVFSSASEQEIDQINILMMKERPYTRRSFDLAGSKGVYEINQLSPGIYKILVQATGYKTKTFEDVELQPGEVLQMDFELDPE